MITITAIRTICSVGKPIGVDVGVVITTGVDAKNTSYVFEIREDI
ncbi:MAG: hypothetical protein QXD45_06135 [Candidatus Bathyarchaeia archaeon]